MKARKESECLKAFNKKHIELYDVGYENENTRKHQFRTDDKLLSYLEARKLPGGLTWEGFFDLAESVEFYRFNWNIRTMFSHFGKIVLMYKPHYPEGGIRY